VFCIQPIRPRHRRASGSSCPCPAVRRRRLRRARAPCGYIYALETVCKAPHFRVVDGRLQGSECEECDSLFHFAKTMPYDLPSRYRWSRNFKPGSAMWSGIHHGAGGPRRAHAARQEVNHQPRPEPPLPVTASPPLQLMLNRPHASLTDRRRPGKGVDGEVDYCLLAWRPRSLARDARFHPLKERSA
jgi:hypothetical protein